MHDSRLDVNVDDISLDDFQDSVSEYYSGQMNLDIAFLTEDASYLDKIKFPEETTDLSDYNSGLCLTAELPESITINFHETNESFEFVSWEEFRRALKEYCEFKSLNMKPEEIETAFDAYESQIAQMKAWGRNWQE